MESNWRACSGTDLYDREAQAQLEAASNELLRVAGAFQSRDGRVYTEYDLSRKHEPWEVCDRLPEPAECESITRQVWAIEATHGWDRIHRASVACGLSDRQMSCVQWRYEGFTFAEIGVRLHTSERGACKVTHGAYRLLRRHLPRSFEWALWDVLCEVFGGGILAKAGRDKPGRYRMQIPPTK